MSISRRKFVQLSSVAAAGVPLGKITRNNTWYDWQATDTVAATDLYALFKDPASTAKPFVRWWWNGNRIVKEELLRELDMLKTLGIGGVEINSIRFPETSDAMQYKELTWLSEEWMDMLDFTLKAAKERGMICDIIMGSGWPFGGEFLTKDEQTQMMALGTKDVTGPQTIQVSREELFKLSDPPISSKNANGFKELAFLKLAPATLSDLNKVIDLDAEIGKETISINVPEGKHVLYFLVKLTGFMAVMFGAPGASGPVLNHYNKGAVQKYLNRMSDALTPKIGKLGERIRSVFTDSLELEGANWCDDMLVEFQNRRKYALLPYLPFMLFKTGRLGRKLPGKYGSEFSAELAATLERVRYDFEITKIELFQERFYSTFLDWCKANGVKSRIQAYGKEFHPSDASMQPDIPECETWIRRYTGEELKDFDFKSGRTYSEVNKFVSSGARLAGKKEISCEEITNTELVFNATLETIKITADQSNLSGVTHSILHGFNYSPKEAPFPGWVRYGTFFNERNPWWPYLNNFISYKSRLSAIFQNGTLVSNVAVMHPLPDLWSKHGVQWDPFPDVAYPDYVHNVWEAIHQNGNGCDYISESIMQKATVKNGKLVYGPRQYNILLVIAAETIYPDTARAFKRFTDAGGQLVFIGVKPHKSAGFYQHDALDTQVAAVIGSIKNASLYPAPAPDKRIVDWYKGLQAKFNIRPYMTIDNPQAMVSQNYYKFDNADAFFIVNSSKDNRYEFNAVFDVNTGKAAWLWDAQTGERYLYPTNGAYNKLHIKLGPAETKLIVFDNQKTGARYTIPVLAKTPVMTLSTAWEVTLNHVDGSNKVMNLAKLVDFKDDKDLVGFAGTATYQNTFDVKDAAAASYLNLGKVIGVTEVTLNGVKLGTRWYGDHLYNVQKALKNGKNVLEIKLTTTLGNYMMTSLKENKDTIKWLINKKQTLYSVGVLGPVQLT